MYRVILLLAFCFLSGTASIPHATTLSSDAPEYASDSSVVFKAVSSYEHALQVWKTPEDIAGWIAANFSYDMARALRLSETRRANKEQISIYDPSEFFDKKAGVCVDLSRFGVETLRRIDPGSDPKYLMIGFNPIQIKDNLLRRHWLVSFKRVGRTYFFADSERPWHIAGPYDDTGQFIRDYEQYRGRKILDFRELDSYQIQRQTKARKLQITKKP
jgi:hypothetical protein